MRGPEPRVLLTCEHGGNRVPRQWQRLFARKRAQLDSHRGWDAGALSVARGLASALRAPLVASTTTRLLVDLNRSPHNPAVFSELTGRLPREQRAHLLARYHQPHWDRVRAHVASHRGTTLHVSLHSFTPHWRAAPRRFALGILYDPARRRERCLAIDWQQRLRAALPEAGVRRNAPYRGDSDGLTSALRREFPAQRYLGLELELNQAAIHHARERRALVALLAASLRSAAGSSCGMD